MTAARYPLDEFRTLAGEWHGGQGSAFYALASTGTPVLGLAREVRECIANGGKDTRQLERLAVWADVAETVAAACVDLFSLGVYPDVIDSDYPVCRRMMEATL